MNGFNYDADPEAVFWQSHAMRMRRYASGRLPKKGKRFDLDMLLAVWQATTAGKRASEETETLISKSGPAAILYAVHMLGKSWKQAEKAIYDSPPEYAFMYEARLKSDFGERALKAIKKDRYLTRVARHLNEKRKTKRWN